ncbi:MAG: pyridoxal 5'-phosphate synthase glutaminase subunit PdxT [Actinobacteria bacterium]|nr:pyridoxal 5'-phosphate synthase glutaminase subunit PdxT [Actinomycetota bacterium]
MGPIGVLALQGDFREHLAILDGLGIPNRKVKLPEELIGISGLIIPGGESTTIEKLSHINGLYAPIRELIHAGMPVFGTCAGLILLANKITDGILGQVGFGGLDVEVKRNAFGSQLDSFEAKIPFFDYEVAAAFIRAPIVLEARDSVEVVSRLVTGEIVGVQSGNILGISFHPELVGESRVHSYFIEMCKKADFYAKL